MFAVSLGLIALAVWLYLVLGRDFFWIPRPSEHIPHSLHGPVIAAIVPARNEAAVVLETIPALVQQDYAGYYHVFLVDDHSTDRTGPLARQASQSVGQNERLTVIQAPPLPEGWTGKLWALETGMRSALEVFPDIEYFLFTDADILHPRHSLSHLVALMEAGSLNGRPYALVSLMARLHCQSLAEKLLIPAFVFFFQMLYPFRRANHPNSRVAAAAGGVVLVERRTLDEIGGLQSIRSALIDDCALAAAIKRQDRIWIGLSPDIRSVRVYRHLGDIWRMVSRTAFTQLKRSAVLLFATVAGMLVTYLAPPLLLLSDSHLAGAVGALCWILMAGAYFPTVRFYRLNPLWSLVLPLSAFIYTGATLDSAYRHWMNVGGEWKGRFQARA